MFSQTGVRIDRDSFWVHLSHGGGAADFGYAGMQGVGTANLPDEGLLPYTPMNGSIFPASDVSLTSTAPKVGDSNYASGMLAYVRRTAQDTFEGQPVNFLKTFTNTISPGLAGTDDPNILGLLDLEIWG